uniref:Core-2/I-branching enzyme n=1 Tax=viral metagenome TaxID=1070528 RepID=A0A6C0K4V8_9ZZZZ
MSTQHRQQRQRQQQPRFYYEFLMLAHGGVTQPNVWDLWMEKTNKGTTRLHVVSNRRLSPSLHFSEPFCNKYRLTTGIEKPIPIYMNKTSWGSFSIVVETIRSIKIIMDKHPIEEDGMLYILSGYDIPIRDPTQLQTPEFIRHITTIHPTIPDCVYGGDGAAAGQPFVHSQWMGLRFSSLQKLLLPFLRSKIKYKNFLIKLWKECLKIHLQFNIPPDESWWGVVYKFNGLPQPLGGVFSTLVPFQPSTSAISPITWTSFTEDVHYYKSFFETNNGEFYYHKSNLRTLLEMIHFQIIKDCFSTANVNSRALFFRKIAPTVTFPVYFLNYLWGRSLFTNEQWRLEFLTLQNIPQQQRQAKRQEKQKVQKLRNKLSTVLQYMKLLQTSRKDSFLQQQQQQLPYPPRQQQFKQTSNQLLWDDFLTSTNLQEKAVAEWIQNVFKDPLSSQQLSALSHS